MINKIANTYLCLDSIVLNSGDVISLECKLINNRPWYNIYQESQFNKSSYYDGNDFDRCFDIYSELVLAFKGIKKCEELSTKKEGFRFKSDKLVKDYNNKNVYNTYDNYFSLKSNTLFLGMSDF